MHESGYSIKLPNGKLWGVAGAAEWTAIGTVKMNSAHILIPIDEINGISPEDIGNNVLALVEDARFCQAQDFAYTLLNDPGFEYLSGQGKYIEKIISDSEPYLREFQGKDQNIDKCISLIEQYLEKQKNKAKLKLHKEKHRKIASANYERLFIKLGRKYGFKCLCCGSGDSLQVDHIKPVSSGGNTEIDNLQLLCKKCNLEKGV